MRTTKTLIRLRGRAGWSESSLGAHVRRYVFSHFDSYGFGISYVCKFLNNELVTDSVVWDGCLRIHILRVPWISDRYISKATFDYCCWPPKSCFVKKVTNLTMWINWDQEKWSLESKYEMLVLHRCHNILFSRTIHLGRVCLPLRLLQRPRRNSNPLFNFLYYFTSVLPCHNLVGLSVVGTQLITLRWFLSNFFELAKLRPVQSLILSFNL